MSTARIWKTTADGGIAFATLMPVHLQDALEVFNRAFIPYETVSVGLMVAGNEQATVDLDKICTLISKEGTSIVALDVSTNQVIGVAFNKIQTPEKPGELGFLEILHAECCNDPSTEGVLAYLENMDSRFNPFEHFGVASLLDHIFLVVLPEFRGKKIAHGLVESTENMANALASGEVHIANENGKNVGLVWAIFTSRISQHIGRALGWEELLTVGHDEFTFAGKKFSERIGPEHPDNILMAKRIIVGPDKGLEVSMVFFQRFDGDGAIILKIPPLKMTEPSPSKRQKNTIDTSRPLSGPTIIAKESNAVKSTNITTGSQNLRSTKV